MGYYNCRGQFRGYDYAIRAVNDQALPKYVKIREILRLRSALVH